MMGMVIITMLVSILQIDIDTTLDKKQKFIFENLHLAKKVEFCYGVPAYLCLAQSAAESKWGKSNLSKYGNNFFGVRHYPVHAKNGFDFIEMSGRRWCCYESKKQSFLHYGWWLENMPENGIPCIDRNNYKAWARWIRSIGYAGQDNHEYEQLLIDIIEQNNLVQL